MSAPRTDIQQSIDLLESFIKNPTEGLPEEIFLWVSRVTPMINVDLLIKNDKNETLLTWREDVYHGSGWHIPGGIIRYKETISDRIMAVAESELGAKVEFEDELLAINQVIQPFRRVRGHFISLLYRCKLLTMPTEKLNIEITGKIPLAWAWHAECPQEIISAHEMYREFI